MKRRILTLTTTFLMLAAVGLATPVAADAGHDHRPDERSSADRATDRPGPRDVMAYCTDNPDDRRCKMAAKAYQARQYCAEHPDDRRCQRDAPDAAGDDNTTAEHNRLRAMCHREPDRDVCEKWRHHQAHAKARHHAHGLLKAIDALEHRVVALEFRESRLRAHLEEGNLTENETAAAEEGLERIQAAQDKALTKITELRERLRALHDRWQAWKDGHRDDAGDDNSTTNATAADANPYTDPEDADSDDVDSDAGADASEGSDTTGDSDESTDATDGETDQSGGNETASDDATA